jgi:hypothetical protein
VWDWRDQFIYDAHVHLVVQRPDSTWLSEHHVCTYRAQPRYALENLLRKAGFDDVMWYLPEDSGFYQPILVGGKPAVTAEAAAAADSM